MEFKKKSIFYVLAKSKIRHMYQHYYAVKKKQENVLLKYQASDISYCI